MQDKAMKDLEDEEIVLRVEKDPLIGKKIGGRYEIVSVLGRGGMGSVYKAHQADIDRFVAVKTLHQSKVVDGSMIKRFQSEAQAVSRVRHPNTVMLYDFGVSTEGVPFLVMELLEGVSFRKILKDYGCINLGKVDYVFQQVCAALSYAHDAGIVHKDLKPENIMLCDRPGQRDWVYVLDFGIAGLMESPNNQSNEIVGSPPYMSPEQCSGQGAVDHRSDIYSAAICIFEAITGKFPFQARNAMEMMEAHVSGKPKLLKEMGTNYSTLESLSQLISKALEKKPDKRQQTIREFAAELDEAVKKDSKRGMALKDRVTLEVNTPRAKEFVETKAITVDDDAESDVQSDQRSQKESKSMRSKGIVDGIKALIGGDSVVEETEPENDNNNNTATAYHFSNCPHCDAPTEAGISLCLSCGRSLASKGDFSKIRASKGEFSLPKYQELGNTQTNTDTRGLSQRTRQAMIKGGRVWTQPMALMIMSAVLIVCVFLMAGGSKYLSDLAKSSNEAHSTSPSPSPSDLPNPPPAEGSK